MARLLMVSNDVGGANILAAVAPALTARGHALTLAGGPPALQLWRAASLGPLEAIDDIGWIRGLLDSTLPDLVVTGTSELSDLERLTWLAARDRAMPTLAAVDAWMNYRRRTMLADGRGSLPDAFAVADKAMARGLKEEGLATVRTREVGQPHLEALCKRLRSRRRPRRSSRPLLVFFSEGTREARPPLIWPGYDQFSVAERLIRALSDIGPVDLHLLPHPLEDVATWYSFLDALRPSSEVALLAGGLSRDDALCMADGIIGMTSMALVEAAFVGAPTLSLQPERTRIANPFVDGIGTIEVVADSETIPAAVASFIGNLRNPIRSPTFVVMENSIQRFCGAVDAELAIPDNRSGVS